MVSSFRSRRRMWLFRLLAVGLGLSPFLLAECICVVLGIGSPDKQIDPFVGFQGSSPLFVANADTGRHEIALSRQICFRPDSFRSVKPANEYRIFCLGGSTVQGRPYSIESSFTTWLELSLSAADPSREFEVVNCGGISYATYRLVPILQEVLSYAPDLIIIYAGHNEFLEDRSYARVKHRSPTARYVLRQAKRWRVFNVAIARWNAWQTDRLPAASAMKTTLPAEVEARLDYAGGLELYHRDPDWQQGVIEHFDFNLRRMVAMCRTHQVPVWLANPVCNLRSSPPFKSQHRDNISADELTAWNELRDQASERFRTDPRAAVKLLEQAKAIDDQHAGLVYDLGKAYETLGRMDDARREFVRAKDQDICPLRLTESLRERLWQVADEMDVPLIDVDAMICQHSRHGIPGGFLLVDHVHPSISGHQMIANLMTEQALKQRWVTPVAGWQSQREERYDQHLATLDDRYYLEGQRRLEGLRIWAQGRVTIERDP